MSLVRILAGLVLIALSAVAMAGDGMLIPHKAEYKVKISLVSGRLNTELRRTDEGYVARYVVKPTGMARMFSKGKMDVMSTFGEASDGVIPIAFQSVDTIRDDPDVNLTFDWDVNQAAGTVGDEDVVFELDGISYDFVSMQYELMHDMLNGGPSEHYEIFDVDKMRTANVTLAGSKRVKTKFGEFDAVGVQHQREGSSRVMTFWCVEELGFLPVIMQQHRKGKEIFKASLVSYESLNQTG